MADDVRTQTIKIPEYITLNEGDSSYHFLFDENPSVSFIINFERLIQDVNKKCCDTLGYKKRELVGQNPLDIIHPFSRTRISNVIDQLFNKEVVTDIETDMITHTGEIKKILFSPGKLIEYNKSFAVLLSGVDITETKKTLHEFEKSNELFTKFMNLLTAGIYIKDQNNVCVFKNNFIADNFDTDLINKISPKEDASGLSLTRFVNLKDKNGKERYCEITTFKIHHKDSVEFTGGIILDLTEKVEADRIKKERDVIFKTVFDNSGIGILLNDFNGKIIECNPLFIRTLGYTPGELKLLSVQDISHPADYKNEMAAFNRALEVNNREAIQLQKRFYTRAGEVIWTNVTINIVSDDLEKPSFALQLVENITEKKLIKEALNKFEYRNKAIVTALPDLIFVIDVNGFYIDFSAGNPEDLAMEESKLIGSNVKDIFSPKTASYILNKIINCVDTGIPDSMEYVLDFSGEKKSFEARIVKYEDNSVLGVVRNITQFKNNELQLRKYAEEMAELNASKNKLFSIIAHDLRSPFHALLGLSEILANEIDNLSREEIRKIGSELHSAFKNEYRLLENLLTWSLIQQDKIEIKPAELILSDSVDKIIKLLSWFAANKKVVVKNLIDKKTKIKFDPDLLNSILQNLLSNAVKFSPEGSEIKITYHKSADMNTLEVVDEGVGISQDELDKILNNDKGYSKSGTAREQGSGLGLVISRDFIEKHGGKLFIKSKRGKGTTVGFTFP
jgi:PAS domain S-box-containing protein